MEHQSNLSTQSLCPLSSAARVCSFVQSIMTQSMLADVVDYDQLLWSEPTKREAIYQSVTGQVPLVFN